MRQDPVPGGIGAIDIGSDVGIFGGSGTNRECRSTGRALLLCQSGGGQERGYAQR